eukprot:scaffold30151_cov101-Isochrysis_galbana.AAC.1
MEPFSHGPPPPPQCGRARPGRTGSVWLWSPSSPATAGPRPAAAAAAPCRSWSRPSRWACRRRGPRRGRRAEGATSPAGARGRPGLWAAPARRARPRAAA